MANLVKLKRGSGSDPQASDLVVGEVAIRTDNGKLFTKKDNGTIAEISGSGGGAGSDIFINTLSSSSGSGGGSATFNGTATRFTLSNPPDISAQQLLVSINGVIQKPNSGTSPSEGFAIDGADIIFAAAPDTGANFFIVTYGTIGLSEPADNSVTSAKIVNGAIVNDDVNTNAAIAGTKISPNFGSQNIITTGDISLNGTNPTISFIDSNENADFRLFINVGKFRIQDVTDSNSDRFIVHTDGHIDIPGNLDVGAGVDVTGNVSVTSGDVSLLGAQTVSWDSSAADLIFNDYAKINLGTDKDFRMYQDTNNTILQSNNTAGGVYLQGALVQIGSETGEAGVKYVKDDSVELYYDNSKKLETVSGGVLVTGDLRAGDDIDSNAGTQTISVGSVSSGSGGIGIFGNPTNGNSFVQFGDGTASADQYRGWMNYQHASDNLNFGTAGSERMRITSAGRVGINTTAPEVMLDIRANDPGIQLVDTGGTLTYGNIDFAGDSLILTSRGGSSSYGNIDFRRYNGSSLDTTMRIDTSGNVLHGVTSWGATSGGLKIERATGGVTQLGFSRPSSYTGSQNVIFNYHNGVYIGGINTSTTATSFPTSSDYRLKENVVAMSDGITRLKTLKPYKFNFKSEPSKTVDGFFAHEVNSAVPEAVVGEKDGEQMQALDHSKLVPLLTAALQEAIGKIETLETKVAALEAG